MQRISDAVYTFRQELDNLLPAQARGHWTRVENLSAVTPFMTATFASRFGRVELDVRAAPSSSTVVIARVVGVDNVEHAVEEFSLDGLQRSAIRSFIANLFGPQIE